MGKLPASQWYWADWMKDPAVRSVSYAARGLWMDMLSIMHQSDRRGYLQVNGKPVTAELLARMTGGSTDDVSRLLQELDDSGVFSRSETGIIYNRRMVRDEHKRALCSEAGKKGGGNPTFIGQTKGPPKGSAKGSHEDADEDANQLPYPALAQKVCAELCLSGPSWINAIAGAVEFLVKFENKTKNQAVDFLIARAKEEIQRRTAPSTFWFTERKWKTTEAKGQRGYVPR